MKDFILDINQVMEILLRALDHIDVRLVDHGYRVAYMVYKMMQADGSYPEEELKEICVIAALHDIGAYKTEEIDHMMRFESEDVFDHSIYGYLFLKHMSPLKKWARIVLYHHLNYEMHRQLDYEHLDISDMIHLADRMDVTLQTKSRWIDADELAAHQDLRFGRATIELFNKADTMFDIRGNIMNGRYYTELSALGASAVYHEETLMEFIKMIAYSIDFRSETTVSHVVTTAGISMELGKLFGLDDIEMKKIQLGAYLHDIGKISTPLGILEKPGSLSQEELQIMRAHTEIGQSILKGRIDDDVVKIACRHHERMDGSGYPKQLKGDQLTISDRIVAVADMISALAGKRSYKESFPRETVIGILRDQKESGKLCGQVIDAAIRNYDIIIESSVKKSIMIRDMYDRISREFRFIKTRLGEIE